MMYDSTLGRFIQRDPVGVGDLYEYGGDNPVNISDPSGLQAASPQQVWDLVRKRYEEETDPGLVGRALNFLGLIRPQDRASYKQLKAIFDQIRKDCQNYSELPLAVLGACGAAALQARIQALIGQLGADTFKARESASAELEKLLPFALGALRAAAANSKDAEVIRRSEVLLATFESNCVAYQIRQALQGVPDKFRSRLLELITRSPDAFPESRTIADILIQEGTPLPPPPPMRPPAMPAPPALPPPPQPIFA
jgi:hypothetical protein